MKHFSRVLCLLLMLALLLPGALAEAVEQTEQTEQIDSSIEEDEVEKVGDIFDMYQVGSMVEANGKLYTISYGPTICEYDGENWLHRGGGEQLFGRSALLRGRLLLQRRNVRRAVCG